MKLLSVSFESGYKDRFAGNTIWERLKSACVNKCVYEKNTMGEFLNLSILSGWLDFGDITIYLASTRDYVENHIKIILHDIGYHKQVRFEDLNDVQKFIAYRSILTNNISHEYCHYIFADLKLGLTPNQQHYAIDKIIHFE